MFSPIKAHNTLAGMVLKNKAADIGNYFGGKAQFFYEYQRHQYRKSEPPFILLYPDIAGC